MGNWLGFVRSTDGGEVMPRRKKQEQEYEPHTYSVWVDAIGEDGTIASQIVYFGSSKYSARQKFVQAILDNPATTSVEMRVDMRTVARVVVEHPTTNWPWQL